ncbi:20585_t:CDS:2 [Funneliformis geosporum]|nr:20585_t:CDS:2 [Funneliformis geosporum]
MNDIGLMGNTIKLRIQQLQHKEWLYKSPLIKWPYDNATKSDIPHSPKPPKWYDILQTALLKSNSSRDIVASF